MARHIFFILVMIFTLSGCDTSSTPVSPENVYMARHITKVHGIKIGHDGGSDIIVNTVEDKIKVVFNSEFYETLTPEVFFVLRIDKKEAEFTKEEYVSFLGKFHAYLMMTPLKTKENE